MIEFLLFKIVMFFGLLFTFTFMVFFGIAMAIKDAAKRSNATPTPQQPRNFTVAKLVFGTAATFFRKRWLGW